MENARRGLGEITTGTFSFSGREARTAAAPRSTACAANPAPSACTPGSAAKRAPGDARRESTASARTSTSAAPDGTTASTPVNNSLNSTLPPTLRVVLFLPEYDGYPGGARVTFTLAPRLTIAPARGDCATARPLPRSSGSREACASLRVAVRAPRPETSGTTACPGADGAPAASPARSSGSPTGESEETSSGAVSLD